MLLKFFNSSRRFKRFLSVAFDLLAIPLAMYMALALRYGELVDQVSAPVWGTIAATTILTVILFVRLGLYRAVIRYMTEQAFATLLLGISISALILGTLSFLSQATIPRSAIIIYTFTGLVMLGAPRLFIRSMIQQLERTNREPILIYGAGKQGISLVDALSKSNKYHIDAFIDDDPAKSGSIIRGIKVINAVKIKDLIHSKKYKKILLALGSTSRSDRNRLVSQLESLPVEVLTTPSVQDIVNGKATIDEIKEVDIEDLLGRECINPNQDLLTENLYQKNVLITGAGGSIGSELCRQALQQNPQKLVLFELNEYSLYNIEQELLNTQKHNNYKTQVISILGSVQNQSRLENIFKAFSINTIYHAAAYKHVPMVEHNVVEGVRNNIFGTWYCAEAAISAEVEKFVLVSTDKAVRPTNVMGASKRLAELVLQALSKRQAKTTFCMVRFGNVLGSSGSVVPLFRKQIKNGGPITVTHPDITRYFMTISEASQLVIQAGALGKGGDVFVLDMGEPVHIIELARKMIHLSGLIEKTESSPSGDIEIAFTGLRPGEKLYEELLIGSNVEGTSHPRIMTANEIHLSWPETHNLLNRLNTSLLHFDVETVISLLLEAPTAYNSSLASPDWVLNADKINTVLCND